MHAKLQYRLHFIFDDPHRIYGIFTIFYITIVSYSHESQFLFNVSFVNKMKPTSYNCSPVALLLHQYFVIRLPAHHNDIVRNFIFRYQVVQYKYTLNLVT